jgi:hypothetical protein
MCQLFAERGVEIVLDDIGRPSVPRQVLGELIAEHREREARLREDQRRRRLERADLKLPPGVPAIDGSPYEAMVAAGGMVLPSEEFGRPRPNFLEEELEAGQRESAERRRAVARMKDDLGGKQ